MGADIEGGHLMTETPLPAYADEDRAVKTRHRAARR